MASRQKERKGVFMEMTTKRLMLREWEESDAADLFVLARI